MSPQPDLHTAVPKGQSAPPTDGANPFSSGDFWCATVSTAAYKAMLELQEQKLKQMSEQAQMFGIVAKGTAASAVSNAGATQAMYEDDASVTRFGAYQSYGQVAGSAFGACGMLANRGKVNEATNNLENIHGLSESAEGIGDGTITLGEGELGSEDFADFKTAVKDGRIDYSKVKSIDDIVPGKRFSLRHAIEASERGAERNSVLKGLADSKKAAQEKLNTENQTRSSMSQAISQGGNALSQGFGAWQQLSQAGAQTQKAADAADNTLAQTNTEFSRNTGRTIEEGQQRYAKESSDAMDHLRALQALGRAA